MPHQLLSELPAGYIGSSSSSLSVSVSRSSVPHMGRAGAGLIGEGVIGGRPGVRVPSVACSVGGAAGVTRRPRDGVRRAAAPALRFVPPARRVPLRVREVREVRDDRADVRRFDVAPRLRRVVARLLFREPVVARFFRRVLLAIVGPPLILMER